MHFSFRYYFKESLPPCKTKNCSIVSVQIDDYRCIVNSTVQFDQFSPIIGGNDTGKSILVEAIMYALGARIEHVHKSKTETFSVFIKLKVSDGSEKLFQRISSAGVETLKVDQKKVLLKNYREELNQLNVFANATNIFGLERGWESFVVLTPAKFSQLLEKAAGLELNKKLHDDAKRSFEQEKKKKPTGKVRKSANLKKVEEQLKNRHVDFKMFIDDLNLRLNQIYTEITPNPSWKANLEYTCHANSFSGIEMTLRNGSQKMLLMAAGGVDMPVAAVALAVAILMKRQTALLIIDNFQKTFGTEPTPEILDKMEDLSRQGIQMLLTWQSGVMPRVGVRFISTTRALTLKRN
uniref:AAA_15 domain-containing protein n=1 Tax=Caenorhabditis tropicalis TaxID=1561998 RepID=A0A1I7TLS7_9PELO